MSRKRPIKRRPVEAGSAERRKMEDRGWRMEDGQFRDPPSSIFHLPSSLLDASGRVHNNPRLMARTINHPALQPLKAKFPDVKFLVGEFREMVTVVVPREDLLAVATFL